MINSMTNRLRFGETKGVVVVNTDQKQEIKNVDRRVAQAAYQSLVNPSAAEVRLNKQFTDTYEGKTVVTRDGEGIVGQ